MKKIFGYDSKLMRMLGKYTDMLFLNALFVICCIPVFTIGAAQSALYSGMRALQDNADSERSCYGAFFHGLRTGFLRITIAWCVVFVFASVSLVNLLNIAYLNVMDPYAPVWISILAVVITAVILTPIPLFHSRFDCSALQLIRNAGIIVLCNPIITLLQTVLLWLPIAIFFIDIRFFIIITPAWLLGYFSIVSMIGVKMFNASFKILEDNYHNNQKEAIEAGADENDLSPDASADSTEDGGESAEQETELDN